MKLLEVENEVKELSKRNWKIYAVIEVNGNYLGVDIVDQLKGRLICTYRDGIRTTWPPVQFIPPARKVTAHLV
jgi:hypothetical protein